MARVDRKRAALVTGGCRGIGLAIARRLASDGYLVAIWDIREEVMTLAASFGENGDAIIPRIVDVTSESDVQEAMRSLAEAVPEISILVNNAGINGPTVSIEVYSLTDWNNVVAVNLTAAFICIRAAIPHLRKSSAPRRIVNISSVAGKEGNADICAYSAAKAGLIGLTKAVAKEVIADGILVNSISPAMTETDLLDGMAPDYIERIKAKIPMGRLGRVEEIASAASWLCSEECSFTTGSVIDLSGGRATY